MAALTCDICGGQLSMDSNGEFAVCESCGTRHDKRRMQAKIQEIQGTVKIDSPVQVEGVAGVENLIIRAEQFLKGSDYADLTKAEEYYNRILNLDPQNPKATELKNKILVKKFVYSFGNDYTNKSLISMTWDTYEKLPNIDPKNTLLIKYIDEWICSVGKKHNTDWCLQVECYEFISRNDFVRADICFDRMKRYDPRSKGFTFEYMKRHKDKLKKIMADKEYALEEQLHYKNYDSVELMLEIGADPNMSFRKKDYNPNFDKNGIVNYKTAIKQWIPRAEQKKYVELFQRYGAKKGLFD